MSVWLEDDRTIGVLDLAYGVAERDALVSGVTFDGELTTNTHAKFPGGLVVGP